MKPLFFPILSLGLSTLLVASCYGDEALTNSTADSAQSSSFQNLSEADFQQGRVRIKVTRTLGDRITQTASTRGTRSPQQLASVSQELTQYMQQIGAVSMRRVFPDGRFPQRTQREGLDLWYDIEFDSNATRLTRALTAAEQLPEVEIVEPLRQYAFPKSQVVPVDAPQTRAANETSTLPFNDPFLPLQWHYNNTGEFHYSKAGADINLFPAWKRQTGRPEVIVFVEDTGVDTEHEDLAPAMWTNTAEKNGEADKDDDGNGYIDDIHGYNFADQTATIYPFDHGTHVAGVVAARNGNGLGVCGVAGGDGTPQSGARIMVGQIFGKANSMGNEAAMKYAADNGAVISQNSWGDAYPGYGMLGASMKDAIEYFIKYAGCDENGNQLPTSPMKGGVVIFAAGNDGKEYRVYPASYDRVVSVTSFGPDWTASYFTNRGDWATLMAPGGSDLFDRGGIYSTITRGKDGKSRYGYEVGTSMACPHVSGIAALIASQFGGQGFTADDLHQRLTTALRPVNVDAINPEFAGKLGRGYIDADRALATNEGKAPAIVAAPTTSSDFESITLALTAVVDADDAQASTYELRLSTQPLNDANVEQATLTSIPGYAALAGQTVKHRVEGLQSNTTYYLALRAVDRWGNKSAQYTYFQATTNSNRPPTLQYAATEMPVLSGNDVHQIQVELSDVDGDDITLSVSGEERGVEWHRTEKGLSITLRALAPQGEHALLIEARDTHRAATTLRIPFRVVKNTAPTIPHPLETQWLSLREGAVSVNLANVFADAENELTYEVVSLLGGSGSVETTLSGSMLALMPRMAGTVTLQIVATDPHGARATHQVEVKVVDTAVVFQAYPIPASTQLNLRLSRLAAVGSYQIYNSVGELALQGQYDLKTATKSLLTLDVSKLRSGSYVLHLQSGELRHKLNFIVR